MVGVLAGAVLLSISGTALLLIVLGGLWLCLWQTRWRALGLVIVAAGLLVSGEGEKPDVLVERDGRNVALRAEDGSLALPPATRVNYSVDNWLLADGEDRDGKGCRTARVVVRRVLLAQGSHAIYIEGLSIRSESVAETRGRRPWVPERQIAKPALPSGQAYARDPRAEDQESDRRFDGNSDE